MFHCYIAIMLDLTEEPSKSFNWTAGWVGLGSLRSGHFDEYNMVLSRHVTFTGVM